MALRGCEETKISRVAVGDVLEKGLRIDRPTALPIEHGEDTADARIEIERLLLDLLLGLRREPV